MGHDKTAKDPAFLFYSRDFYEGTRTMLPEERGCYMDLLIYQHQHGIIPLDLRRVVMYCSGCSEDLVKQVLNQKFDQTEQGWVNPVLNQVVDQRRKNKPKRIAAGTLAGLISSRKIGKKRAQKIKESFSLDEMIMIDGHLINDYDLIKQRVRAWFNQMVNHPVDHLVDNIANANANANANNIDKDRGCGGKEKADEKIAYADHVRLTESEYQKLHARPHGHKYGPAFVARLIEKLDGYKANNPKKKYTSDYLAITQWVEGAVAEEFEKMKKHDSNYRKANDLHAGRVTTSDGVARAAALALARDAQLGIGH